MNQLPLFTFIVGTRPEAIKLAPVIKIFSSQKIVNTRLILTGQHKSMVNQVIDIFNLKVDLDLQIMKKNQTLSHITIAVIDGLNKEFKKFKPDLLIVQGDTSTAFSAALAAFYNMIPIAHVEAGLRTDNLFNPYPEECNRRLISQLSSIHFAPTELSRNNLLDSNVQGIIKVTGNTVIDALKYTAKKVPNFSIDGIELNKFKLILATVHRRENWGKDLIQIAKGLRKIVEEINDVVLLLPMHINPIVREPLKQILGGHPRIFLTEPLSYENLVSAMKSSTLIISDSGGIQEEAPTFGKPVLVLRENTERIEVIEYGVAKLVGTNKEKIFKEAEILLTDNLAYSKMSKKTNPYGDGNASIKILETCFEYLKVKKSK